MATLLSIDVDPRGAIVALEQLGVAVERHLQAVAQETARAIQTEARARVRRRTGRTAGQITAEPAQDGQGYVVYVKTIEDMWPNLDIGIEFGTRYLAARPFLHPAVALEEGPHRRRLDAALNEAIAEASR